MKKKTKRRSEDKSKEKIEKRISFINNTSIINGNIPERDDDQELRNIKKEGKKTNLNSQNLENKSDRILRSHHKKI